jgi:hypothetical protein
MSLRSLSLLLLFAFQLVIAAPSNSANTRRNSHNQISFDEIDAETSLSSAQTRQANHHPEANAGSPTYDQYPGIILHGKDDREKELSLCEAGIVSACRSIIEAVQSDSDPFAATEKVHGDTTPLTVAPNTPILGSPEENETINIRLFPSVGFLVVSCAVFCVITVARRCMSDIPFAQGKEKYQQT